MTTLTRLDAYIVRVPLPRPLLLAHQTIVTRDYTIVEATDSDGVTGRAIGYARGAPVDVLVSKMIAPMWVGSDLDASAATYDRTLRTHGMQGSHGIFWRALSLADIAVHDLRAKQLGIPLGEFLGGQLRPVPTTLAGCYPLAGETDESLAQLMRRMRELPCTGIKVTASGDYSADTARLRRCRDALGDGPPLIIDLYGAVPNARALIPHARDWTAFGMGWLEDPFGFDAFDDLAELVAALPYPVAVGDEQSGLQHFSNLMRYGRIGVVRIDATTCGGVTGFIRIATLASLNGLPISCHVFHHLHTQLACVTTNTSVEYMLPETGVDAIDALVLRDLDWGPGGLVPSRAPGIGCEWNEAALHHYRAT